MSRMRDEIGNNKEVKPDLYTKVVLSVIAGALVLNLISPFLQPTIVKAKVADPLEEIANEMEEINSTLDTIESYGLKVRGTNSSEVPVKVKE